MHTSLFVVILKYVVSLEEIDAHRPSHLNFLDHYYSQGIFIVSGRQVPTTGGIILAKCKTKQDLEQILKNDPFAINNLAEYTIYEFIPTKHIAQFDDILN